MTRPAWLRIPAIVLVPAFATLTPVPRGVLLSVSAQTETLCRAIGGCDTSVACGPAACTPCVASSGDAPLACLPACDAIRAERGDAAADPAAAAAPDGSPAPRGIVCICLQCGQGVPGTAPALAPPSLTTVLPEAPPGALASVSHEPASPPPKAPPIVT